VANLANTVSAYTINPITGTLTPTVPPTFAAGNAPEAVAVDPTGKFAYVANSVDNNVSAYTINAATGVLTPNTFSPTFASGTTPTSVTVDPTGKFAYVANELDNDVSAYTINPANGALSVQITFAAKLLPTSVTVDPTGKFAYVANQGSNNISAYTINRTTGGLSVQTTFAAGTQPVSVTVDPTGQFAYVANFGGGVSAYTINAATGALTPVPGSPFAAGAGPFAVVTTRPVKDFLIRYFSNLNAGDSSIDITNNGASANGTIQQAPPNSQVNINGSICVNVYAFAADEQEVSCCSCLVTPNGLYSLSAKSSLLNSILTASMPNELVVKLHSTVPASSTDPATGLTTQTCNPGIPAVGASGALAFGTTLHGFPAATGPTFQVTETPFLQGTLSPTELERDVQECQFIQILGSGQFGLCKGCQNAGLGAAAQ